MRASPLTDKARPGGRPRRTPAANNPFAIWLSTCGLTPAEVADELGVGLSTVYNARGEYFKPGRQLAIKIASLTTDPETGVSAVPVDAWDRVSDKASEASKPKDSKPKDSKPKASKPKDSKPKASKPKDSKPKASKPKASKPRLRACEHGRTPWPWACWPRNSYDPAGGGAVVGGTDPCTCGRSPEEHGHDPEYPSYTGCTESDCIAYEPDPGEATP